MSALATQGWQIIPTALDAPALERLRQTVFANIETGQRCLLDHPDVRTVALRLRDELIESAYLPETAVAIQAIAFDKNSHSNWKVTWHQDLMFPLTKPASADGYDLGNGKDGVPYARPPRAVLEKLLAVRLHLDDCDERNGPLRVIDGSHLAGVLVGDELVRAKTRGTETTCLARAGEALLMKPLLLHASSPAQEPRHRRVLHLVYHSGDFVAEPWHRAISGNESHQA